jgi:hypothetical protein
MPQQSISKEEAERRIALVEEMLRAGHPPKGVPPRAGQIGAIRAAGLADGASQGASGSRYQVAVDLIGREADWSLWVNPEPEGRGTFEGDSPDGYNIKGRSTYYDADGKIRGEWVKTTIEQERQEAMLREAIQGMVDALPKARPTKGPSQGANDLLACYNVSDHHFGMLSMQEETGNDYNLDIAEKLLIGAFDHLIKAAPPSGQALVTLMGDLLHYDSFVPETPQSRNVLDADGRYPQMVRAAVRSTRYLIKAALTRHESVHVIVERGNHDPSSSIFLMEALSNVYESEPRVTIDTSPAKFHYHRFGNNLIGIHHGDTVKMKDLPLLMAHDRATDWGETEHRFWWTGHVHHDATQEFPGVKCESFRVLAAKDAWHSEKGYRSKRDMKAIVLHREYGEVARHTFNPDMI